MTVFLYASTGRAYILDLVERTNETYRLNACTVYYGVYPGVSDTEFALECNFSVRIFF